jgi:hypothetical protein
MLCQNLKHFAGELDHLQVAGHDTGESAIGPVLFELRREYAECMRNFACYFNFALPWASIF